MTINNLQEKKTTDEETRLLLEENLKVTREIHEMTKKVTRFIFWSQVMGVIKIFLIIGPIIAGFIFLPPLLKDVFSQYKDILGVGQGVSGVSNLKSITPSMLEILKR